MTCRLIDRPLRPSFPSGFRNEVHVVGTILGADMANPHDVLAINGASAALMLSGIPFDGPIGAVRVAWSTEGTWIPHPTYQQGDESCFELVVAGRALSDAPDADVAIMMVEAGGTEHSWKYYEEGAPKVTEEVLAAGLEAAKTWIRESITLQRELVSKLGAKPIMTFALHSDYSDDVFARVSEVGADAVTKANAIVDKAERNAALDAATESIIAQLSSEFPEREREIKPAVRSLTKKIVRKRIVEEGIRIDGRGTRRHPAAIGRSGPPSHRARFGPLPAGRDPGPQRDDARDAADEATPRHHRHRPVQALHAPLQLPAVLHRRDRLHAWSEAS